MIHILRPPSLTMTNTLLMASDHLYFFLSCIPLLLQITWRDFEVEWNSKNLQQHHLSTKCSESLLIHELLHILYLGLEILWQNYFRPLWKTGIKNKELNVHWPSWAVICILGCFHPMKAGRLLKKYLFPLIDWPFLKLPLWGEIPDLKQTQMCHQKIQSGSGWLTTSNSNSLSYLQVHPPLTPPFLPSQAKYIYMVCHIYMTYNI